MKLVLFGASGMIGSRLLAEALRRGHRVTVAVRDPKKFTAPAGPVTVVSGDVTNSASVASVVAGHDAVLSAVGGTVEVVTAAAQPLLDGLRQAGVKRLLIVGGAGSLEVAPGVKLLSLPNFPAAYKGYAIAHDEALQIYQRNTDLDWSYLSPAALIAPGERTGRFRLGRNQLVADAKGESRISAEDYAVALLDEVEKPAHIRQRFTLAY